MWLIGPLVGPAGRTSWADQLNGPAGQTSWMDQLDRPAGQISLRDQFSLLEALASSHIRRLTFQFVHCRSFRVRRRTCLCHMEYSMRPLFHAIWLDFGAIWSALGFPQSSISFDIWSTPHGCFLMPYGVLPKIPKIDQFCWRCFHGKIWETISSVFRRVQTKVILWHILTPHVAK